MLVSWVKISKFYVNEKLSTTFCFMAWKVLMTFWFIVSKSFDIVWCSCGVYPSLEDLQTSLALLSLASWLAWETWGSCHQCSSHGFTLSYMMEASGSQAWLWIILSMPPWYTEQVLLHLHLTPLGLLTCYVLKMPALCRSSLWNGLRCSWDTRWYLLCYDVLWMINGKFKVTRL